MILNLCFVSVLVQFGRWAHLFFVWTELISSRCPLFSFSNEKYLFGWLETKFEKSKNCLDFWLRTFQYDKKALFTAFIRLIEVSILGYDQIYSFPMKREIENKQLNQNNFVQMSLSSKTKTKINFVFPIFAPQSVEWISTTCTF